MMRSSRRYAVTGGIGSGKSYLLAVLKERGYPVFSCDEIYAAMCCEEGFSEELASLFPACVREGSVDRSLLSKLVFSDETELRRLNAFTHPKIMHRLFGLTEREEVSFSEVPLLFEGGYEKQFNGSVLIVRGEAERIYSVRRRSGLTEEEVRARMVRQYSPLDAALKADIVVCNNGGRMQDLADAVLSRFKLPFFRK